MNVFGNLGAQAHQFDLESSLPGTVLIDVVRWFEGFHGRILAASSAFERILGQVRSSPSRSVLVEVHCLVISVRNTAI